MKLFLNIFYECQKLNNLNAMLIIYDAFNEIKINQKILNFLPHDLYKKILELHTFITLIHSNEYIFNFPCVPSIYLFTLKLRNYDLFIPDHSHNNNSNTTLLYLPKFHYISSHLKS